MFTLTIFLAIFSGKIYHEKVDVEVVAIYDGDTFTVNIKDWPDIVGKKVQVRIYGIDTPELKSKNLYEKDLARKAKERLVFLLRNHKIDIRNVRRDKYFRLLAEVYSDDINVGDKLIEEGLAREYFGNKKGDW